MEKNTAIFRTKLEKERVVKHLLPVEDISDHYGLFRFANYSCPLPAGFLAVLCSWAPGGWGCVTSRVDTHAFQAEAWNPQDPSSTCEYSLFSMSLWIPLGFWVSGAHTSKTLPY